MARIGRAIATPQHAEIGLAFDVKKRDSVWRDEASKPIKGMAWRK